MVGLIEAFCERSRALNSRRVVHSSRSKCDYKWLEFTRSCPPPRKSALPRSAPKTEPDHSRRFQHSPVAITSGTSRQSSVIKALNIPPLRGKTLHLI